MSSSLDHKRIIFDGNCQVCAGLKAGMVRLGLLKEEQCWNFHDLDNTQQQSIDVDRFRNEMALLDMQTGIITYGPDAIIYILSNRLILFAILFSSSTIRSSFPFLYRLIAYNRYIMAVPKNGLECDCFPDKVSRYRLAYIFSTYGLSSVLTFFFVLYAAPTQGFLLLALPWILQVVAVMIFLKEKGLDYLGHMGSTVFLGSLFFLPAIVLGIFGFSHIFFFLISLVAAWIWMHYLHTYRSRYLQLGRAWRISWGLFFLADLLYLVCVLPH